MKWVHHYPRGPRSGPGYRVPDRHHLIDPIRPTRGHTAISPHSGLYAMPSLCGSAEATRARFRAFADHSVLTCRPLRPRGVRHRYSSSLAMTTRSSPQANRLDTPKLSRNPITRALNFVASLVRNCYGLPGCWPPWSDQTGIHPQPPEASTSRLPTGRLPSPPLDITTTSTGHLCRRDLHPLEWQLASLH